MLLNKWMNSHFTKICLSCLLVPGESSLSSAGGDSYLLCGRHLHRAGDSAPAEPPSGLHHCGERAACGRGRAAVEELDAAAEHLPHTPGRDTNRSSDDSEHVLQLGVTVFFVWMSFCAQNGSIMEGLALWKNNVDKRFEGIEDCMICFSVIHGSNYSLPKKACRTCKKKFHSACLVSLMMLTETL